MKRAAVMSGALVMAMAFCALASTSFVGITAPLREQMAMVNSDELIRVNLVMTDHLDAGYLSERAAGMSKVERRRFVLDELKRFSESSQREVRGYLERMESSGHVDNIQIIWMANAINFEATPAVIERLARLKGVRSIDWDEPFPLETILDVPEKTPHSVGAGDQYLWNLERIRAPEVWDLGFTGQGVVLGNIDTGTDYNHSDLADHIWINVGEIPNNGIDDDNNGYIDDWRGWDFVNNDNDPMDQSGHGTSTAGIAAGDGTGGTQTGVAPDAEIMILLSGGEGPAWAAVQYAADNGADVVTSSQSYKFAYHQPDYGMFRQIAEYELAAGVIHSNSIGNQGGDPAHPIPWNISTPGNCPPPWLHPDQTLIGGLSSTLGCGATDINDIIKSYSGRGPAAWEDIQAYYPTYPHPMPPEYWDYPYDNGNEMGLLKPDVSAPTDVTTTQLGGGYTSGFSGTSAATPHLGGSLCLMLSAAPSATPAMLCEAIQMTALDLGSPGKDNLYGAGRIDVYEAVQALMVGWGWVNGYVTDATTSLGLPATVRVPGTTRQTVADTTGYYYLGLPGDSTYVLEASYFGYVSEQQTIFVPLEDTVALDFELWPAATGTIEGHVYEATDGPIEGAEIRVLDTPLDPVYTDNTGYYSIDVPGGTSYDVQASAIGYEPETVEGVFVPENQSVTVDFALTAWPDILIWEPDPTPITGAALQDALAANGYESTITTDLLSHGDLSYFQAIFVAVGIYANNHVIQANAPEALAMEQYVVGGGNLYLEGGDVWYYDPLVGGHDFGPLFGINATSDGSGDLYSVSGVTNTLMPGIAGMTFSYAGENSWIDHISPFAPAELVFQNTSNSDPIGVAKEQEADGHTIGTSFEFGGLVDGAYTKEELVAEIADFFGLMGAEAVSVQLAPGTSSVPQGGTFEIEVTVTNNTGEVQVFDAWADVVLPNSNPYGPVAGPRTVTLDPNETRVRTVTQRVPSTAPLGVYTYCGKIGTYPDDVMDQDCFDIEVTP